VSEYSSQEPVERVSWWNWAWHTIVEQFEVQNWKSAPAPIEAPVVEIVEEEAEDSESD